MMDLFRIAVALLGGYAAFMGLTVMLMKLMFPFLTREQLKGQNNKALIS